jgi:hypothetical protein
VNEALWTRVQSALDERRDPLEDPAVRAWLLEHPDDALALGDLRAALETFEKADLPLRASRISRRVPLAAAALALVALGSWLALRPRILAASPLTAAQELELHPIVPAPWLGNVQSWEVVSTLESAQGVQTVRATSGRIEFENGCGAQGAALAQASTFDAREERSSLQ